MFFERKFQNKAATHAHLHLKHVAESLDRLVDQYGFDRILIGGPVEATGELQHLLSKRVRAACSSASRCRFLQVLIESSRKRFESESGWRGKWKIGSCRT